MKTTKHIKTKVRRALSSAELVDLLQQHIDSPFGIPMRVYFRVELDCHRFEDHDVESIEEIGLEWDLTATEEEVS